MSFLSTFKKYNVLKRIIELILIIKIFFKKKMQTKQKLFSYFSLTSNNQIILFSFNLNKIKYEF